jgi:hypothetical protein
MTRISGVGFSTADADGYVADQDQIGRDFVSVSLIHEIKRLIVP